MVIPKKISKMLLFSIIILTILAFLSNVKIASSDSLEITANTDKESYLLRQMITTEGNITLNGSPASDLVIAVQVDNPRGTRIAYHTLTVGNPTQQWPINITDIFLKDQANNPINTAKIDTLIQVGMTIYNPHITNREIYATITVFDGNMALLQSGSWSGTIGSHQTTSSRFDIYIPEWACSGKALVCSNVYSHEPKLGGMVLSLERTAYFCISRTQQGLLDYPTLPPPPPQTTPGIYNTSMRLPPDPIAGEYTLYATCQISPTEKSSTTTTFSVENSGGYPPQASFIYWPAEPYLNMTVDFDASSSSPEGFNDTIVEYEWDFGDGTPKVTETDPTITYAYQQAETLIVTLNVTDNEGLWSTTSKPITILAEFGPTANFTWSPPILSTNQTGTFDASDSTSGWSAATQEFSPITTYTWNFSDGTGNITVTTPITTHIYTQPDNYTVTLTVIDAVGRSDTTFHVVEAQNQTFSIYDVNQDHFVDMMDLYLCALAYGSQPGDEDWDPRCDVNDDDFIDMMDLYLIALHYGETT